MKFNKGFLKIAICTALLTGCISHTAPIHNVNEAVIASHSSKQVKQAILMAGAKRGWQMSTPQDGIVMATLTPRDHIANVKITYSSSEYKIEYVSSSNLDENKGKIHKNYNRWVNNLDQDIKAQLSVANMQ